MKTTTTFILVAALLLAVQAQEHANFTVSFSGGLPFCSQCGEVGQYACSPDANGATIGDWNNGEISFMDPLPVNTIPHAVKATVHGTWTCDPFDTESMFAVQLNGITHSVRKSYLGEDNCLCNSCNQDEVFNVYFRNGIPEYNKGAYNVLKFDMYDNSVCINSVDIDITYNPVSNQLPHDYVDVKIPDDDSLGCSVCNDGHNQWCSSGSTNRVSLNFTDNLPNGALLVGVDAFYSYNFVQKSYSRYTILELTLDGTDIGSSSLPDTQWKNKCGCYDDASIWSEFYQRGWPQYQYGGSNEIEIYVNRYSSSYGNMCIGRLALDLIYYIFDDEQQAMVLKKN